MTNERYCFAPKGNAYGSALTPEDVHKLANAIEPSRVALAHDRSGPDRGRRRASFENNVAEMLFRNVAVEKGYVPNWTNSSRAASEVLGSLGIPLSSVSLASGSGVSRNDRLTPLALTTILQRVADSSTYPELAPVYWGQGMPLAGISGTLSAGAGRFTTTCCNPYPMV